MMLIANAYLTYEMLCENINRMTTNIVLCSESGAIRSPPYVM